MADLPEDAGQQGITGPVEPQGVALAVELPGWPFFFWTDVPSGNPEVYLRANRFAVGQVYYVNDASTAADSLTTAAGSAEPGYDGRSPDKPMLSIQAVLDAYDLGPGDVALVDAGTYPDGFTVGAADAVGDDPRSRRPCGGHQGNRGRSIRPPTCLCRTLCSWIPSA